MKIDEKKILEFCGLDIGKLKRSGDEWHEPIEFVYRVHNIYSLDWQAKYLWGKLAEQDYSKEESNWLTQITLCPDNKKWWCEIRFGYQVNGMSDHGELDTTGTTPAEAILKAVMELINEQSTG